MQKIDTKELFEMDLYYREVIGRGDAPDAVKKIDIIRLLDHIAAMESEMELLKKGSGVGFNLPGERRIAEIMPGTPKPSRRDRRAAAKKKPVAQHVTIDTISGQTEIFDFIGGDR